MNTAYTTWKTAYYAECGSEAYIKSTDPSKAVYAVSEGIGYGMLITAHLNKSDEFGKLWAFYKARKNPNGLMRWRYPSACTGSPTNGDNNSASDADVDAALALIVAAKAFNNAAYLADAKTLIAAVKKSEIATNCSGSKSLIKPSDGWGGCDDLNPSYFAPGYFRLFGKVTSDSSFWDKAATDSLALLATYQAKMNGQVPDWGKSDGTLGGASHGSGNTYGFEACRVPWRVAVDYGWYQSADAKAFLTTMYKGILEEDRPFFAIKPESQNSSMFVGGYATVGTGIDQATADTYFADWYLQRSLVGDTPVDATTYFSNTLKMLYLITMGGRFDNGQ
jgi:endo-1,4-beta-D-glucanase Y